MRSVAEVLDREGATVGLEHGHFERMLRRRDRKRRNRRIGAGALAIIVALATLVALTRAFDTAKRRPADGSHPGTFTGMVITYTSDPYESGDLVAQDPATGEVRTVVDSQSLPGDGVIYNAAISGDGRWVAFDVGQVCGRRGPGLWVTDGVAEPRPLTKPCESSEDDLGDWAWSLSGAQLLVVLGSPDALVLIDPATGGRTDLGEAAGDVTSLA